jgi:nucleotide-binding universal stress UspA family protein
MNILVGYDRSNSAKDALKWAKARAKAFDANVDMITSMVEANNDRYEDMLQAELGLEYAKTLLAEDNIHCETHLLIRGYSPGEELIQFAKDNQISEISFVKNDGGDK